MRQILIIIFSVILGVSAIALAFTIFQAQQERLTLSADLQYRTRLLADSLKESIAPAYENEASVRLNQLVDAFSNRERLVGVAVYDSTGARVAGSSGVSEDIARLSLVMQRAIERNEPTGEFLLLNGVNMYVLAEPLPREDAPGVFIVVQDAEYIDQSVADRWQGNLVGVLAYLFLFAAAIAALVRWVIFKPLLNLVNSVKSARSGRGPISETQHGMFFRPLATEIGKLTHSLAQARTAASEEARMRLEQIDTPWTAERLKEFIKAYVKDRPIYVVSNVEPFVHRHVGREIQYSVPAGGVATAIGSVMEACGGTWFAYGGGNADKETADEDGKIMVPPEEPKYTLKRVWLSEKEVKGYYRGFSNEALWPLSHIAHIRPLFRKDDWTMYRKVNGKFAETLLSEIKDVEQPLILIQDYHFALLPQMIKAARPDAHIAFFWHIPWPSAETFSICPWRKQVLEGLLGADIIGFHTQQYCNNFIETVGKEIESLTDLEQFSITHNDHTSFVKPFPISIAFSNGVERSDTEPDHSILDRLGIKTENVVLGVDRLDYTKGILERLRSIEFLLDAHPEYHEKFTFLQIGSPTRQGIKRFDEYALQVSAEVDRINAKFKHNGWQPIVFEHVQYSHEQLMKLYRLANVCLVTSLHDGMNLVAKEFVAARDDQAGVLVLSQFTGAARDLKGALIVNPYSAEETAEAVHKGLIMSPTEQHRRMKTMRSSVKDYNVYRWAAELIKAVAALR